MNKNPLLVKSSLTGKIPFMKGKTAYLYKRYLSDHKFKKILENQEFSETVSAFTLGSNYKIKDSQFGGGENPKDFVFDETNISSSKFFNEEEWVALGMLLRAYKEVENINLLHLYNCLYSGEGNRLRGFIVSNRSYTLYSSTQLPVKVSIVDPVTESRSEGVFRSLSKNNPTIISARIPGIEIEKVVEIILEFTGNTYQPSTLVEGVYSGLSMKSIEIGKSRDTVPEGLKEGEYSDKLVEFFAGTLITPLSDSKLISNTGFKLPGSGSSFWENVKINTRGLYNQDGYLDRRNKA